MFEQHKVILSGGACNESFQSGDISLAGVGEDQRKEQLYLLSSVAQCEETHIQGQCLTLWSLGWMIFLDFATDKRFRLPGIAG